ncbi:FkbM family methyltransferase [Nocardioides sp. Soil796]|uniref:FkbM family methyltransferase n=1 Tax=Nocardioides sp. Soil796 TaxID=1736412 RepID=UPI00070D55B1|nr:FkbM family methyltransferase [Nocardioides sp. Soil796]KRF15831.1 hypothetical protein ASH02_04170 [Nocardioides sp. Soil796]
MTITAKIFGIDTHVVNTQRATFFVPAYAAHRPVARRIANGRVAEPDLHKLVRTVLETYPGSMVHAGTFFGDMLPSFSAKCPGTVYAFEPVLENYLLARAVTEVNDLDNVVLFHAGLGSDLGVATLKVGDETQHFGGASYFLEGEADASARTQTTSILSLDHLMIEDLRLLQLDVEGFELQVLNGAAKSIAASRPVIVLEDGKANCGEFLRDLGYAGYGRVSNNYLYLLPEHVEALDYADRKSD